MVELPQAYWHAKFRTGIKLSGGFANKLSKTNPQCLSNPNNKHYSVVPTDTVPNSIGMQCRPPSALMPPLVTKDQPNRKSYNLY